MLLDERQSPSIELVELIDHDDDAHSSAAAAALVPLSDIARARTLIYTSHLFAQFAEGTFQFCLTLFLSAYTNYQSFVLVSTYGFSVTLAVCLGGSTMGRLIDGTDRLTAARFYIIGCNVCVVATTFVCFWLLSKSSQVLLSPSSHTTTAITTVAEEVTRSSSSSSSKNWIASRFDSVDLDLQSIVLLSFVHLFGSFAQLLAQGFLVAIERDWVVVLCETASASTTDDHDDDKGDSNTSSWLSETNVRMKQIDLGCKVTAPAFVGLLIPLFFHGDTPPPRSLRWVCLAIGMLNFTALIVEYVCTLRVYRLVPPLASKQKIGRDDVDDDALNVEETAVRVQTTDSNKIGIVEYFAHDSVCWAGVALSLLYLNALTFGNGIITSYLLFIEVPLGTIGVLRGVASAVGISGTVVYGQSVRRMSLEATGLWSVTLQFASLLFCVVSMFLPQNSTSLCVFISAVCASRLGLWVFDITVTQMQQERIPDYARGVVGGVQQSLNAGFGLFVFVIGFVFPDPSDFNVYTTTAVTSVGLAMFMFLFGTYLRTST